MADKKKTKVEKKTCTSPPRTLRQWRPALVSSLLPTHKRPFTALRASPATLWMTEFSMVSLFNATSAESHRMPHPPLWMSA